jgi:hypothetical protein
MMRPPKPRACGRPLLRRRLWCQLRRSLLRPRRWLRLWRRQLHLLLPWSLRLLRLSRLLRSRRLFLRLRRRPNLLRQLRFQLGL